MSDDKPKEYAQARRDAETQARRKLESLIPKTYIDGVPKNNPNDNQSTKAMKAAIAYTRDTLSSTTTTGTANNQATSNTQGGAHNTQQQNAFPPIVPTTPPKLRTNEEYRRLKQAMERVKHNIQGRAHEEGDLSNELKQLMEDANDALVGVIHQIEGNREETA